MGWSPGTTYWHLGWAEQRLFVPPAPGFFRLCSPVRNSRRADGVNRGCSGGTEWNGTRGSMGSQSLYRNSQRKAYILGTGKRGGPWHATCPSGLPEATPSFFSLLKERDWRIPSTVALNAGTKIYNACMHLINYISQSVVLWFCNITACPLHELFCIFKFYVLFLFDHVKNVRNYKRLSVI